SKQINQFLFSCLLFGFATFIRPETLVLLGMTIPLVVYTFWKEHLPVKKIIFRSAIFLLIPFFFYFIWMDIFLKYYMPVPFSVNDQINKNLFDFSVFFTRFGDLNSKLMFGKVSSLIYGYFMDIFVFLLAVDLIIFRRVNKEGRILLYGIVVVYIGLPFLGYLIPWVDFWDTTKRGIYKMFPLMLLYMRDSPMLQRISDGIKSWEFAKAKPVPAVAATKAGKTGQTATQTKNRPNNPGNNGKANQKKKK
ncbi:MAG TPA: hypothetical protein VN721_07690, partial [Flavipsychrobacter sp.]|nr:hypothetical protein [Flavipsychrobacter sp.]